MVLKKFIWKDESDGNICVNAAVQHFAVQCSLVHLFQFIAVQYCAVQYSLEWLLHCSATQCIIIQCDEIIFVSVLLSTQVMRFSASRRRGFLLEMSFMKQHFWFILPPNIFFTLIEIDTVHCTTSYFTVVHCTTLQYTVLHLAKLWYTVLD